MTPDKIQAVMELDIHPSTKVVLLDLLLHPGDDTFEERSARIKIGLRTYYRCINVIRDMKLLKERPVQRRVEIKINVQSRSVRL